MKGQDGQNNSGSTLPEGTAQETHCIHQFSLERHTGELGPKGRTALNEKSETIHFVPLCPVTPHTTHIPELVS